jgi:hypothetical protein
MFGFVKVIAASVGSVFFVAAGFSASGGDINPIQLKNAVIFAVFGGALWFFPLKSIIGLRNLPRT